MFKRFFLLALFLMLTSCHSSKPITVFLVGDSTMADKPDPEHNPERGWGQMLPQFFDSNVTVQNHARNGRSSKSFMDEGLWEKVKEQIKPGDYVFIQFGHNDQKDKDPKRYTNPWTGYRLHLIRYIEETRAHGGVPILLSSIVRRKFNEYGTLEDTHGLYPFVVRDVAREYGVPFIDMQLKSEKLVQSMGPEDSKSLYLWVEPGIYERFPEGKEDNTHFNEAGATAMAQLAVDGLVELNMPVVKYLKK